MISMGGVAMMPNGVGSLGRVVGVFPLYRDERGADVASVVYEPLQHTSQRTATVSAPGAGRQIANLVGSVGGTRPQFDSLLAAQEAADRPAPEGDPLSTDPADMSVAERAQLAQIQVRDAAVRQEEEAHAAAAGPLAGSIQYEYQRGPDGRNYVVNGSVPISFGGAATDEQQAANLRRIQRAAVGVQLPSAADLQVFQQATGLQAANRARVLRADGAPSPDQGGDPAAATGLPFDLFNPRGPDSQQPGPVALDPADPNHRDNLFARDEQSAFVAGVEDEDGGQSIIGGALSMRFDPFDDVANRSYRQAERLGLAAADRFLVDA